jgi:hypothetical protein
MCAQRQCTNRPKYSFLYTTVVVVVTAAFKCHHNLHFNPFCHKKKEEKKFFSFSHS